MESVYEEISIFRESFKVFDSSIIPEHIENKTLQLFLEHNDSKIIGGESVIRRFLRSLYYISPKTGVFKNFEDIKQVKWHLREYSEDILESKKYFEIVVLYLRTHLNFTKEFQNFESFLELVNELNTLYKFHRVPFKIDVFAIQNNGRIITKKTRRSNIVNYEIKISPIFSDDEERNKLLLKKLLGEFKFDQVNNHLNNAQKYFVSNDYKSSIKESYLALEKLLKELVENHSLATDKLFPEFQKKYLDVENSIFGLSEVKGKIKSQINMIYSFRSKLDSHSHTEDFDNTLRLYQVARFQLGEVVNLCILLLELSKK